MNSWPLTAVETEMRRLKVLQYLETTPTYETSASVLTLHVREVGVPTTLDQMVGCVAWLAEMELITLRNFRDEPIARLTTAGHEVAKGNRVQSGVLRPTP